MILYEYTLCIFMHYYNITRLVSSLTILDPKAGRFIDKSIPSRSVPCLLRFVKSMLSIHCVLGLPCFLAPGNAPCMISFSRQSPFLNTWPKCDSFLLWIEFIRQLLYIK